MTPVAIFKSDGSVDGVRYYEDADEVPADAVVITNWLAIGAPPNSVSVMRQTSGVLYWHDPRTTEEKAADARTLRDQLLRECDWTQGRDIADSVATPWATYRSALRNLPTQSGFPNTITWPTPP